MAQILRPDEQISIYKVAGDGGETTDLHNKVNDESDSTYIKGTDAAGYCILGLPVPVSPGDGDSIIKVRAKSVKRDGFSVKMGLYNGTTLISESGWISILKDTMAEYSLTGISVSDYSDLKVKVYLTTGGSGSYDLCSEVWVEVPDAVSGIGLEMGCNF